MSNCLSTAQQLPNNVLRTIIKKIINEKRLQLTINEKTGSIRLSRPNWVENEELPHDAAHLVREFRVNMSMSSVVGGSSLRLLTEYLGDCRFPIANKLYVTINGYHTEARELREVAIANINAFCLFLRSLVPADVAVKLACVSEDEFMAINESTVGMMYEEYFEVFAGSLYAAGLGPEFQHLSDEEVPDHIVANYGNTGKNLVIWCMNGYGEQSSKRLLEYTMLLALVCPRFCRADVYLGMIPDYNKCLAAALKSGPYSKYALQLSRLITRKH
ncbi:hypothetical protein GGI10_000573 [Coemansia sp. RSA 2530]|nr:hypothetical protein GGI10_000573 [Coemansia sp. RSA 2530]